MRRLTAASPCTPDAVSPSPIRVPAQSAAELDVQSGDGMTALGINIRFRLEWKTDGYESSATGKIEPRSLWAYWIPTGGYISPIKYSQTRIKRSVRLGRSGMAQITPYYVDRTRRGTKGT